MYNYKKLFNKINKFLRTDKTVYIINIFIQTIYAITENIFNKNNNIKDIISKIDDKFNININKVNINLFMSEIYNNIFKILKNNTLIDNNKEIFKYYVKIIKIININLIRYDVYHTNININDVYSNVNVILEALVSLCNRYFNWFINYNCVKLCFSFFKYYNLNILFNNNIKKNKLSKYFYNVNYLLKLFVGNNNINITSYNIILKTNFLVYLKLFYDKIITKKNNYFEIFCSIINNCIKTSLKLNNYNEYYITSCIITEIIRIYKRDITSNNAKNKYNITNTYCYDFYIKISDFIFFYYIIILDQIYVCNNDICKMILNNFVYFTQFITNINSTIVNIFFEYLINYIHQLFKINNKTILFIVKKYFKILNILLLNIKKYKYIHFMVLKNYKLIINSTKLYNLDIYKNNNINRTYVNKIYNNMRYKDKNILFLYKNFKVKYVNNVLSEEFIKKFMLNNLNYDYVINFYFNFIYS